MSMLPSASQADNFCKGCTATVHISEEEIQKLFGHVARIRSVKLTTEAEYERRMQTCRACEAFQLGTTCRWCGCLMEIKAKLQASTCPAPAGSRW
ncbi:DUF6171 family protein [Paenibacillus sp. P96]|uniref:DUF6171 family protein n=1 Tax=Paenibacillus zeirhizosphaerae TaxID=2987519 RepID=A0ABT9FRA5_9BACL|nr:DUF6171 family protein [Paenibacillus sp. P96]MDP4097247.1 DUF6171 family protein [Paenibacillus sp. P96]